MGAHGPKPGFKAARKEGAATPLSFIDQPKAQAAAVELSAADRENPEKLGGEMLRALAHRRGVSLSAMADMTDAKIRMQLLYITNRQYDAEEVA
jgi:hypothetical protein